MSAIKLKFAWSWRNKDDNLTFHLESITKRKGFAYSVSQKKSSMLFSQIIWKSSCPHHCGASTMVNLSPSRWKELWCWGNLEPGDSNGEEISTHRNQQDRFHQSRATSTLVDSLWRLTASARSPGPVQDEGNNSHLIELFGECNEVINANTIA